MQICKLVFPDLPTEKRYLIEMVWNFVVLEEFISEVYEIN